MNIKTNASVIAVLAVASFALTGCASDSTQETCERIDAIQDEHGRDLFPSVSANDNAADELDAVFSAWQDTRKAASDDQLSSAMESLDVVFEDYEDYIAALDDGEEPAERPSDKEGNRTIAANSGATIDSICSEF